MSSPLEQATHVLINKADYEMTNEENTIPYNLVHGTDYFCAHYIWAPYT